MVKSKSDDIIRLCVVSDDRKLAGAFLVRCKTLMVKPNSNVTIRLCVVSDDRNHALSLSDTKTVTVKSQTASTTTLCFVPLS